MKKFVFSEKLSKIIDFYSILSICVDLDENETQFIEKIRETGFLEVPFNFLDENSNIKKQYAEISCGNLDIFNLFNVFSFDELLGFKTIENVKDAMLSKSEDDLRKVILKSLVSDEKNVCLYIQNPMKIIDLVDECSSDDVVKSRLLGAISKPLQALTEYLDLLFSYRESFEKVYKENIDFILKNAEKYGENLNELGFSYVYILGEEFLKDTFNFMKDYETIYFTVSIFSPIGIGFDNNSNFLMIGIYFDEISKVKEHIKNEIKVLIFKNLGDETRFKIFKAILNGVGTNKELAELCRVAKPTISYHINQLIRVSMIAVDEDMKYFVNKDVVLSVLKEFMDELN